MPTNRTDDLGPINHTGLVSAKINDATMATFWVDDKADVPRQPERLMSALRTLCRALEFERVKRMFAQAGGHGAGLQEHVHPSFDIIVDGQTIPILLALSTDGVTKEFAESMNRAIAATLLDMLAGRTNYNADMAVEAFTRHV